LFAVALKGVLHNPNRVLLSDRHGAIVAERIDHNHVIAAQRRLDASSNVDFFVVRQNKNGKHA
jgi:hypothetical protein